MSQLKPATPLRKQEMFSSFRKTSGRPGQGQRSEARQLRGELAEAAAGGGVWRGGHDPHCQEEAGCAVISGPRSEHLEKIITTALYVIVFCLSGEKVALRDKFVPFC